MSRSKKIVKRVEKKKRINKKRLFSLIISFAILFSGIRMFSNVLASKEVDTVRAHPRQAMTQIYREIAHSDYGQRLAEPLKNQLLDRFDEVVFTDYELVKFHDLTKASNLTVEEFEEILPDSCKEMANDIVLIEHSNKPLNGIFVVGLLRQESGNGTSTIMIEKKNPFGLAAYDNSPYESAEQFKSLGDSVYYLRDLLYNQYFNLNDARTLSIMQVNKKYCSTPTWCSEIMEMGIQMNNHLINK